MKAKNIILSGVLLTGVVLVYKSIKRIPRKVKMVNPFYMDRFMGKWYELVRMGNIFTQNEIDTTIHFGINSCGEMEIKSRSYNKVAKEFEKIRGKIKFKSNPQEGKLRVSYLGPFYSDFNILAVNENYKYALVSGKDLNYLFILSREKSIPKYILEEYIELANSIGFDISKLEWVEQSEEYEDKFNEMECIIVEGFA